MIQRIKPWILPLAMLIGILLHDSIGQLAFLSKYLIFVMLLITYTRVSVANMTIDRGMLMLLATQIFGAIAVYLILYPVNQIIAQSTFICVFCPTATAAPVITSMLGGNLARVASYSLLSNITVAITGPIMLAYIGDASGTSIIASVMTIATNVLPVILGPLIVAILLKHTFRHAHDTLANHQSLSFYIWAVSLIIVVGNAVSFMMKEPPEMIPQMLAIALLSMIVCIAQFAVGRLIGRRYGDAVSGAQSLGQKNTVLAIWLALTYLNPIASVGPASYIVWHNTINSWQIYRKQKSNNGTR